MPKNAIGILGSIDGSITNFIAWLRSSVRYAMMLGGTPGEVDEASVDSIYQQIISEVEEERHDYKAAEGTLGVLTEMDTQALMNKLLAFALQRSSNITSAVAVNETLEKVANLLLMTEEIKGRYSFEAKTLTQVCPALAQIVTIKRRLREEAEVKAKHQRNMDEKTHTKLKSTIADAGQAPPSDVVGSIGKGEKTNGGGSGC